MAKTDFEINVNIKVTVELTLEEARALNAITTYGSKAFLEGYYKQLGRSYLSPFESGVTSLFSTIQDRLPDQIKQAREILDRIDKLNK